MTKLYPLLFLSCAGLLSAQVTSNSVTVTAVRNTNLQPDQAVFLVTVATPVNASRDAVVSALQGAGITAADFYGVRSAQVYNDTTQENSTLVSWSFVQTSTLANMKSAIGLLSAVQKSIAGNGSGFSMSFGLQGIRVSQQAQLAQPCSVEDLMSDARAQAQKLASATGATVGPVMAATSEIILASSGNSVYQQIAPLPVCALVVKFQMNGGI